MFFILSLLIDSLWDLSVGAALPFQLSNGISENLNTNAWFIFYSGSKSEAESVITNL